MQNEKPADGLDRPSAAGGQSQFFTVRLWKHDAAGGSGYRGSVRHVISGAYLNFCDWPELAAFMVAQLEEGETTRPEGTEGGA